MPEAAEDPQQALSRICRQARQEGAIALDLEFHRESTYYAKLCLIQLATRQQMQVVDPLSPDLDLGPLHDLLADPEVEIVLHAGRQDLEILYHRQPRVAARIFDTQIAAALLGLGEQIGYAALVESVAGVKLSKLETLTDWTRRPLSRRQLSYALDDVRYLFQIRDELQRRLMARGRLPYLEEETAFYRVAETYVVDPQKAWQRVGRKGALVGRDLATLREVSAWREDAARALDVPRGRVLTDDMLLEIARCAPQTREMLAAIRGLRPAFLGEHGAALLAAVRRGLATPEADWPESRRRREDPQAALVVDLMDVLLRKRAIELEIAPSYLGNRQDLHELFVWLRERPPAPAADGPAELAALGERAALAERPPPRDPPALLTGWRHGLIGAELVALVEGRLALRVAAPGTGGLSVDP